jgi:hypothetical protein
LDLTFYPYEVTLYQNDIFVQKRGPFQEIWAWFPGLHCPCKQFVNIFREQTAEESMSIQQPSDEMKKRALLLSGSTRRILQQSKSSYFPLFTKMGI